MDYKTRIKVAAVIGIIIVAIIFIIMIVFVKNNKTNNNIPVKTGKEIAEESGSKKEEQPQEEIKDITIDNVYSLAIKNNCLVKINEDTTSEVVKKLEEGTSKELIDFAFEDSTAYLLYKENIDEIEKTVVYSVNLLKSNYPEEKVFENEEFNYLSGLDVYSGKIYYVTSDYELLEYSISEEATNIIIGKDDSEENASKSTMGNGVSFKIDKENNVIYLAAELTVDDELKAGVFKMDVVTNNYEMIISTGLIPNDILLKDNYLVCNVDGTNYLYNGENASIWEIGQNVNTQNEYSSIGKVAFYEEQFVIYTDEEKVVLKDFEGNILNESLYSVSNIEVEGAENVIIENISMITSTKLQITFSKVDGDELTSVKIVNIDLSEGLLEESTTQYSNILNIK